jgi:transposase
MNIDIRKALASAKEQLAEETNIPAGLRVTVELLILIITILSNKLGLDSTNSSKPPSSDPNRLKKKRSSNGKKPGGQEGRRGVKLEPVSDPDQIEVISIDRQTLPPGDYQEDGFEIRQLFDINISREVTEYRAQVLRDSKGKRYVANFPSHITQSAQYGFRVKAHAVYLSQFQLIPYQRVQDYFFQQCGFPLSVGSLFNFNKEAYRLLETFDTNMKAKLILESVAHVDETGINVGGKRIWLHSISNGSYAYLYPHEKRGTEAMETIGIIPFFRGILIHDHWKSYFTYKQCLHSLCNAHHLRELECAKDQYAQLWAGQMQDLLQTIHQEVEKAGGLLNPEKAENYRLQYREIISQGMDKCPLPLSNHKKRGRIKKSKPRNLLERLCNYETEVLRFMTDPRVPFTNNQGENDIRMTKVQQKISGCFRSIEGAKIFCRIRSYILTCQKHGLNPADGITMLFQGKLPNFDTS